MQPRWLSGSSGLFPLLLSSIWHARTLRSAATSIRATIPDINLRPCGVARTRTASLMRRGETPSTCLTYLPTYLTYRLGRSHVDRTHHVARCAVMAAPAVYLCRLSVSFIFRQAPYFDLTCQLAMRPQMGDDIRLGQDASRPSPAALVRYLTSFCGCKMKWRVDSGLRRRVTIGRRIFCIQGNLIGLVVQLSL
ncbi:hypothetical protein QBC46DRAFT_138827 [Diplogelasinospora grovesii]|uniref:Secreted protein n=1 Tax=Diplogelasinospora grovesii TaxID=303347 RepID=A0AAN6N9W8_9PEZI|nr:hypothetical protein QBC46DRAFT_138827 [Diplogelasinospora grovesii]